MTRCFASGMYGRGITATGDKNTLIGIYRTWCQLVCPTVRAWRLLRVTLLLRAVG